MQGEGFLYAGAGVTPAATAISNQTERYTYDQLGNSIYYTYDSRGNVASRTDAEGNTISYEYDQLGRLKRKLYPDGTAAGFGYDSVGRLTYAGNRNTAYSFAYDPAGRVTGITDSEARSISYAYDQAGRLSAMRSPLGDVTSYVYDGNGRLGSIGSAAGAFTFTYDTLGRRSGLSYPNGVKAAYTYDNVGRLTGLYNTTSAGITFAKNEYTFDNVGNRVTNTNEARTAAYSYDDNYRLTSANYSTTGWSGVESSIKGKTGSGKNAAKTANATAIGNQTEHYTYDPLGNRLTAEKNRTYEYNAANQLVRDKDATYVYDRNGNLISKTSATGTTTYGYDFENRLTSVTNPDATRVEFKYDVFGRRIEKAVFASGSEAISSGSAEVTRYFYDGEDILVEYDGSGNVGNRYTHGPGIDEPLALTTDKGVYFYHADGLGSIVALTDKNQTVVQDYQYGFFGDLKDLKNRIKQPYTYTAREYDRETGLYFYRARYYDAEAGRFITKDPIGFRGGMNMYAYVGGNPINYIDPWGLRKLTEGEIALARTIFGDSIDYSNVNIYNENWAGAIPLYRGLSFKPVPALSPNGNIYYRNDMGDGNLYSEDFSKASFMLKEVFMHEMVHVWQYQKGLWLKSRETFCSSDRNYNYQIDGKLFDEYGIEQQAMIVQDYFRLRNNIQPTTPNDDTELWDYQRLLQGVF